MKKHETENFLVVVFMGVVITAVNYLLPDVLFILCAILGAVISLVLLCVYGVLTTTTERHISDLVRLWNERNITREEAVNRVVKGSITEETRKLYYKAIDEVYGKVASKYY